jgi:hypothetical protein
MKLYEFVDADGIYVARKANGTRLSPGDYRGHPERKGDEIHNDRICSGTGALRHLRICKRRSAERSRFHDRRPRGKFCYARHVANHGKFDEAEPER